MNRTVLAEPRSAPSTLTPIEADPSRVQRTSPREYGIRFVFGGLATAAVGIISAAFGPAVAGLFLAFPAILIAGLTLVGRHEGAPAAGANALGATIGATGLVAFGAILWQLSTHLSGVILLAIASVTWFVVAFAVWAAFDSYRRHRKD